MTGLLSSWSPPSAPIAYRVPSVAEVCAPPPAHVHAPALIVCVSALQVALASAATQLSTAGGQALRLAGSAFGPVGADHVDWVRYSSLTSSLVFEATSCAVTVAHAELACASVPGVGTDFVFQVSIGGQQSATAVTSYAAPAITNITLASGSRVMATTGGEVVRITGHNLGPIEFVNGVTYSRPADSGETATTLHATDCAFAVPHVELWCRTVPGVGRGYQFSVDVAGQSATFVELFDYRPPHLETVHPQNVPNAGGGTVVLTGQDFGSDVAAVKVVSVASGVVLSGATGALSMDTPGMQISFLSPALTAQRTTFVMRVAGQQSEPFDLLAAAPVVFSVQVTTGVPPGSPSGTPESTALVVLGEHFGSAPSTVVTLNDGDGSAESECAHASVSDARIVCFTAMTAGVLHADVFGRLLEVPFDMLELVRKPVIADVSPRSLATVGGLVVLSGSKFRTSGAVWLMQFQEQPSGALEPVEGTRQPCEVLHWSDTSITVVVPPGQGLHFRFLVTALWVEGLPSVEFSCVLRRCCDTWHWHRVLTTEHACVAVVGAVAVCIVQVPTPRCVRCVAQPREVFW